MIIYSFLSACTSFSDGSLAVITATSGKKILD